MSASDDPGETPDPDTDVEVAPGEEVTKEPGIRQLIVGSFYVI